MGEKFWRTPLDFERVRPPLGDVIILSDRCKGCEFCVAYCPRDVLAMSDGYNRKGYHTPEVVKTGECLNCSLCEAVCPEFAIFAREVPDRIPVAALPAPTAAAVAS